MNRLTSALAFLALAAVVPAQAGKAQQGAAKAEYDKLVAEWKAEADANRAAMKKLTDTDEYKTAVKDKNSEKLAELRKTVKQPDRKGFGERALKLADQFGDDGLQFLTFAAGNFADKDAAKTILERIEAKYLSHPGLTELLERPTGVVAAVGQEKGNQFLAKVASESKNEQCQAWAYYWQGSLLSRGKPTDEQKKQADELMAKAEKLAKGDLADRIAAPKFEKEHLQIGMTAPDIVGEDIDGVAFKLSDYRGKVVVVDFWGFW